MIFVRLTWAPLAGLRRILPRHAIPLRDRLARGIRQMHKELIVVVERLLDGDGAKRAAADAADRSLALRDGDDDPWPVSTMGRSQGFKRVTLHQ